MPNNTVNYNLKKPLSNENYNIQDQNDNMDAIDSALKGLDTKFEDIEVPVTSVSGKTGDVVLAAEDVGAETPEGAQSKVDALAGEGNTKTVKQLSDEVTSHKAECAVLIPKSGSTANAILLDIVLTDKKKGSFRALANNTGNVAINGKAFKKDATTQIPAGGIKVNKVYDFYYDEAVDSVFILAKTSGTAQPSHVLAPYTFSNDDGEQVGTIPSKSAQTYTPTTANQTIASGQYLSGTQTIAGDADLKAANIKSGVNIFGVAGTLAPFVSTIESIQKGVITKAWDEGITSITQDITTIDLNRSIAELRYAGSYDKSHSYAAYIDFNNNSQLRIERGYPSTTGENLYFWEVTQFNTGVLKSNVQRGVITAGTETIKTFDVAISSVNPLKSKIIFSNSVSHYNISFDTGAVFGASFINNTTIRFTRGYPGGGVNNKISWQVIEFN